MTEQPQHPDDEQQPNEDQGDEDNAAGLRANVFRVSPSFPQGKVIGQAEETESAGSVTVQPPPAIATTVVHPPTITVSDAVSLTDEIDHVLRKDISSIQDLRRSTVVIDLFHSGEETEHFEARAFSRNADDFVIVDENLGEILKRLAVHLWDRFDADEGKPHPPHPEDDIISG